MRQNEHQHQQRARSETLLGLSGEKKKGRKQKFDKTMSLPTALETYTKAQESLKTYTNASRPTPLTNANLVQSSCH